MLRSGTVTFAVRILLGVIFIYAGAAKIGHFNEFAAQIAAFRILPAGASGPLAVLLPFFEVGLGLYLLAGLLTAAAATIGGIQLVLYAGAIASAVCVISPPCAVVLVRKTARRRIGRT